MEWVREKDALQEVFWYRVNDMIAKRQKTLQDVAEATGIKYSTILGWRTNKRLPDLRSALLIANFLEVNVEFLCGFRSKAVELEKEFEEGLEANPRYKKALEDADKLDAARETVHSIGDLLDTLRILAVSHPEDDSSQ